MSTEDAPLRANRIVAQPPIEFYLTTEGSVVIEFATFAAPDVPAGRFGVEIPAEEAKNLRLGLEVIQTTQETLAAKPPAQGAH